MAKILLAEDDVELNALIRTYLLYERHQVEQFQNGTEALLRAQVSDYDLLILDLTMPGISGLDIVEQIRSAGKTSPILIITGRSQTSDKTKGLDAGADDYLTKPFPLEELGARVRALLRRSPILNTTSGRDLKIGDLKLDAVRHALFQNGQNVALLPKEYQLIEFLMRHPNQVLAPEVILRMVWPSDSDATAEALRSTVKRLRKKVDPDAAIIRTVHKVGYVFYADDTTQV